MWRIGLMGQSCTPVHVTDCLTRLETVLAENGAPIVVGKAVPAATSALFG